MTVVIAGWACADVPQIIPPVEDQPPPRKTEIEIVGDFAGRQLSILVDGKPLYEGARPLEPTGISWRLDLSETGFPATVSFLFSDCETQIDHLIEAAQMPAFLIVRGCDVELAS